MCFLTGYQDILVRGGETPFDLTPIYTYWALCFKTCPGSNSTFAMYLFHSEQRFSTCDLVWCFYPPLFKCYRAHNTGYPQPSLLHEIHFCSKGLADKLRKIFCKCLQPKIVIVYYSYVCFILGGSDQWIHVFEGK